MASVRGDAGLAQSGIWWEEIAGISPKRTFSKSGGMTVERVFKVNWSAVLDFVDVMALSPFPSDYPTIHVNQIVAEPFDANLVATNSARDPRLDYNDYTWAKVTVSYGPEYFKDDCRWPTDIDRPEYDGGTSLKIGIDGAAQFLTIPARAMKSQKEGQSPADTKKVVSPDQKGRILIPTNEYRLTWEYVTDPPIKNLRNVVGCVNKDKYLGCDPETLLFESYKVAHQFCCYPLCFYSYSVELVFKARFIRAYVLGVGDNGIVGWNHIYQSDPPVGWARVTMADPNHPDMYDKKDFKDLLKQNPSTIPTKPFHFHFALPGAQQSASQPTSQQTIVPDAQETSQAGEMIAGIGLVDIENMPDPE